MMTSSRVNEQEKESNQEEAEVVPSKVLRVLALHGSTGTGSTFARQLESFFRQELLEEKYNHTHLEVVAPDAPFANDQGGGFSWWIMPPGVRSYNAMEYPGFETSAALVWNVYQQQQQSFDVIVAHSQGAILITALLALEQFQHCHPPRGYVLNGVAWPNPYTKQLQLLHCHDTDQDATSSCAARILLVTGQQDRINPPETQAKVRTALEQAAGLHVHQIVHSGGHGLPTTWMTNNNTSHNNTSKKDDNGGHDHGVDCCNNNNNNKILEWIMNV